MDDVVRVPPHVTDFLSLSLATKKPWKIPRFLKSM
jgi:hypothetical protein